MSTEDALRAEFERLLISIQEWAESYLIDLQGNDTCFVQLWDGQVKEVPSAIQFLQSLIAETSFNLELSREGLRPWLSTPIENPEL